MLSRHGLITNRRLHSNPENSRLVRMAHQLLQRLHLVCQLHNEISAINWAGLVSCAGKATGKV